LLWQLPIQPLFTFYVKQNKHFPRFPISIYKHFVAFRIKSGVWALAIARHNSRMDDRRPTTDDRRPTAKQKVDGGIAVLLGLLVLFIYGLTLAPSVVAINDDTLEFQLVAVRGAIPHPTGYPLFAILLTLAARLIPFGEAAFRANLLSAFAGAATAAMTYSVGRAIGLHWLAAIVGAALFAFSPTFWSQATVVEVYTLHALLVTALVFTTLRWGNTLAEGRWVTLPIGTALFLGLGLTHHRTIVLWLPALLVYAFLVLRLHRIPLRSVPHSAFRIPHSVVALLAPLLLYLWLPLRAEVGSIDGTYNEVGFGCWVTACQYSGFFEDNPLATIRPPTFYATLTLTELGWTALGLASVGLFTLWHKRRAAWVLLVTGLVVNALFAMAYRVPDPEVFWLPVLWTLTLFAGAGVDWLLKEARALLRHRRLPRPLIALAFAVLLAPLAVRWATTLPLVDRSGITTPLDLDGQPFNGRDVLSQPLPDNAVIVGLLGEITYLRYLQEAEGMNPQVTTAGGDLNEARLEVVEAALAAGQRPFLTRELQEGGEQWSFSALGPLVEVLPTPQTEVPAGLWPLDVPMGEAVTLVGWTRSPITGSEQERITVAWRVEQPITETLQVSTRLIGVDGNTIHQTDAPPLDNAYPTTRWRPGEVILDTYTLPLVPPGAHLLLILYRAANGSEVGQARLELSNQ
jgi:hypothetical protein